MITIPVTVEITGGQAPYTFVFNSSNSNITFSNVTGTALAVSNTTYAAQTDVQYLTQGDIGSVVTVTFTDANGCSTVLNPVVVSNPCTMQSTLSNNGEFVFVATTTGGSGGYTYNWTYNTALFEKASNDSSNTDNYLSLVIKEGAIIPASALIAVTITDTNNCTLYKTIVYNFCRPNLQTQTFSLVCDVTPVTSCSNVVSQKRNIDLKPNMKVCTGQTIDWSTLNFNIPTGLCVEHLGNGIINVASSLGAQTSNITYTVRSTSGILSSTGTLVVTTPECAEGTGNRNSFTGVPQTIQLTIEDVVSDTRLLNVESRVAGTPDWSTFAFVGSPTWGTVVLNGNRDIVYTITDVATTPTIPDTITWTLNDYNGNQINITDTILRNRLALPVTTTEVICNSCGETTTPQDLLANDTGSIDRSTVQIVLNDPDIVITKDSDNNFIFTSLPGASFSNLCSYKVANIQGAYTPDQNFFVRTACVGSNTTPTLDLTCSVSKVFDIVNQFPDMNAFGVSYLETTPAVPTYASQGGLIVGGNGTVTLTGLVNKTYTFEFTAQNQGACTPAYDDIGTLTVVHGATPNINLSAATMVSAGVYSFTFTYSGIASNFVVTDDGLPANFHTGIVANNGSGTFILYAAAASSIVISATTICGNSTTDTTVI